MRVCCVARGVVVGTRHQKNQQRANKEFVMPGKPSGVEKRIGGRVAALLVAGLFALVALVALGSGGGLTSLARVIGLGWAQGVGLDPNRPNVLIIYTDDQSFEDIDLFAQRAPSRTPAIDALFEGGLRFTQARVTSSMCTPSRYGLHTGQLGSQSFAHASSGVPRNASGWPSVENQADLVLRDGETTIGNLFQAAGYRTGFVGKWHLSGPHWGRDDPIAPSEQQQLDEVSVARVGGFDVVSGLYMSNIPWQAKKLGLPQDMIAQNPGYLTDSAIAFIRGAVQDPAQAPFFMIYAPTLVHSPNVHQRDDPFAGPYGRLESQPEHEVSNAEVRARVEGAPTLKDRTVIALDYSVESIVMELRRQRLVKNTLIAFMSDNNKAKSSIYDDGVLVPAVLYWPGKVAPGESDDLFANIDILPTVLAAADIAFDPQQFDGHSVWASINGQVNNSQVNKSRAKPRRHLLLEQGFARGLVTFNGWKYIRVERPESAANGLAADFSARPLTAQKHSWRRVWEWHPGFLDDEQLYDLNADPTEAQNLAADPRHAQRLQAMRALLDQQLAIAAANDGPR